MGNGIAQWHRTAGLLRRQDRFAIESYSQDTDIVASFLLQVGLPHGRFFSGRRG